MLSDNPSINKLMYTYIPTEAIEDLSTRMKHAKHIKLRIIHGS